MQSQLLESTEKKMITIRLEKSLLQQLKEIQEQTKINRSDIIRQALMPVIKQYNRQGV